jgi:hypothetical protein
MNRVKEKMTMETKYQNNPNYILREIDNECVLVPIDEGCIITSGIISLNDTSAFLWKFFQNPKTIAEAIAAARAEYADPNNELEFHINGYVKQYLELKLMQEV